MKPSPVIAFSAAVLVAGGWAQTAPPATTLSRQAIMGRVVEMLRWKAYWEGPGSLSGHYAAGKEVATKIVRTAADISVFMAGAGVNLEFHFGAAGLLGSFGTFIAGQTNEQAAAGYLANNCGGFRLQSDPSPAFPAGAGKILPAGRVCQGEGARQFAEESFQFTLPALSVPDYISSRSAPADAVRLREAVDMAVQEHSRHLSTCRSATVTIPHYSSRDPSVFVYVDRGRGCAEFSGIFDMRHLPNGSWAPPGKLWSVRPPNDWSWTIQQIKRTTLIKYEIH